MIKKIMNHAGVGLAIGFVCTTACMWAFGAYRGSGLEVMQMFTAWLCASALYGFTSMIYHTHIPPFLSFIIHLISCLGITLAASIASGFFKFIKWYEWFIYVLPVFVVIYTVIGVVSVVLTKHQLDQINKKINHKNIGDL